MGTKAIEAGIEPASTSVTGKYAFRYTSRPSSRRWIQTTAFELSQGQGVSRSPFMRLVLYLTKVSC